MNRRKIILLGLLLAASVGVWRFHERMEIGLNMVRQRFAKRTVDDRLREFGGASRQRWAAFFKVSGVSYLPKRVVFVALNSPVDLRKRAGLPRDYQAVPGTFQWTMDLYQRIDSELLALPAHE